MARCDGRKPAAMSLSVRCAQNSSRIWLEPSSPVTVLRYPDSSDLGSSGGARVPGDCRGRINCWPGATQARGGYRSAWKEAGLRRAHRITGHAASAARHRSKGAARASVVAGAPPLSARARIGEARRPGGGHALTVESLGVEMCKC